MAKIVLVEDDELICAIVARTLAPLGHVVTSVRDGDDALDALWETGPDLAILDCALPGKTGLTILREIRQSAMFGALPVLILTARRSAWHAKMALETGANDYVRKPFAAADLIGKIDRLLADAAASASASGTDAVLLDVARLADVRAAAGPDQTDRLLARMESDIAERTRAIVTALATGDRAAAGVAAHGLRGAADGIGALDLARHCHAIEREGETDGAPLSACAAATVAAIAQARTARGVDRATIPAAARQA